MKLLWTIAIGIIFIISACATTDTPPPPTSTPLAVHDFPESAPTPSGRNLQPDLKDIDVNIDEVVALLPPDAIPAIFPDDIPQIMVTAAEADAGGMAANVRVLGVSINDESRAYPIPFMSRHEIVNDFVGGKYIAATW